MNKYLSIFSVPRSGSSWLGQLINSHPDTTFRFQPFFSYEFQERAEAAFSTGELRGLIDEIFQEETDFLLQSDKVQKGLYPAFSKSKFQALGAFKENTHLDKIGQLLRAIENMKVILLVRDPVKVVESWTTNPKEFPPGLSLVEEWDRAPSRNVLARNFFGFEKWVWSTKEFERLRQVHPERTLILRYEDLVRKPAEVTKNVLDFSGLNFTDQTRRFLDKSTSEFQGGHYSVHRFNPARQLGPYELQGDIAKKIIERTFEEGLERYLLHTG